MAAKTKYYTAKNCNSIIESDGIQFSFDPTNLVCGVWFGQYSTKDSKEQKALAKLKTVIEVTKEDWDIQNKKKASLTEDFKPLPTESSASPIMTELTQVEDVGAVQSVLNHSKEVAKAEAKAAEEVQMETLLEVAPTDRAQSKRKKK